MAGSARPAKSAHEVATLLASAVQTATSAGAASIRMPVAAAYVFVLDLTNAATDVDDTLDIFIQTRIDDASDNWIDVVHFTQILGNGSDTLQFIEKITVALDEAGFEIGSALAEGVVRNLAGDEWRVRWVIVDPTGSNVSFTFSVTAIPM